jgi:hypothetical protein
VQFQQREGQLIAGLTPTNEAVTTTETQATKPEKKPDMATDDDIKSAPATSYFMCIKIILFLFLLILTIQM